MHEVLHLGSEGVFALGGNGEVEFLLGGGFDVGVEVNKVSGRLEVDFAVVWIHFFPSSQYCGWGLKDVGLSVEHDVANFKLAGECFGMEGG